MFNTIIVPHFFYNLPKEVQDLVFEFNWEHRILFTQVLKQLMKNIHCICCKGYIEPYLWYKTDCCSLECLYEQQIWYEYDNDYDD